MFLGDPNNMRFSSSCWTVCNLGKSRLLGLFLLRCEPITNTKTKWRGKVKTYASQVAKKNKINPNDCSTKDRQKIAEILRTQAEELMAIVFAGREVTDNDCEWVTEMINYWTMHGQFCNKVIDIIEEDEEDKRGSTSSEESE